MNVHSYDSALRFVPQSSHKTGSHAAAVCYAGFALTLPQATCTKIIPPDDHWARDFTGHRLVGGPECRSAACATLSGPAHRVAFDFLVVPTT